MTIRTRYLVQVRFNNPRTGWTEWRLADWLEHLGRGDVAVPASFRAMAVALRCLNTLRRRAARYGYRSEYRLVVEVRHRTVMEH